MKRIIPFLALSLLFTACGSSEKTANEEAKSTSQTNTPTAESKVDNALSFINNYVENCNKMGKQVEIRKWIAASPYASASLKKELKKIIDKAWEDDPEMGLGFDPLFDAQDYPSEGFELESIDDQTNYLTLKGKENAEFLVTIHLIEENGKWLVDGCGIVNIPRE
jgi:hypothetical protein